MTSPSPDVHPRPLHPRARAAWRVLTLVLLIESVGGLALLIPLVQGFTHSGDEPLGQRVSIFLAAILAWVWVLATLWGALRYRASWVRGSALTMHVLLFAAGTGVLQFALADTLVGWGLILLAFVGFAAGLLAQPVQTLPSIEGDVDAAGAP